VWGIGFIVMRMMWCWRLLVRHDFFSCFSFFFFFYQRVNL